MNILGGRSSQFSSLAENTLLDAHYILSRGSCTGCGLKLECTINVMRVYVWPLNFTNNPWLSDILSRSKIYALKFVTLDNIGNVTGAIYLLELHKSEWSWISILGERNKRSKKRHSWNTKHWSTGKDNGNTLFAVHQKTISWVCRFFMIW